MKKAKEKENLKYDQMIFKIPEWQLKLLSELWLPALKENPINGK